MCVYRKVLRKIQNVVVSSCVTDDYAYVCFYDVYVLP